MDDSDLHFKKLTDREGCQKAILFFQPKHKRPFKNSSLKFDTTCQDFEDLMINIASLAFKKLYISHATHGHLKKRIMGWAKILHPSIEIIADFKLDYRVA